MEPNLTQAVGSLKLTRVGACITLCVLLTMAACDGQRGPEVTGGASHAPLGKGEVAPTEINEDDWVKRQIEEALSRRGVASGDEWTSTITRAGAESFIVIKGLESFSEKMELSKADRLNGFEWAVQVKFRAVAHRTGGANGLGDWVDGSPGPFSYLVLKAQKKKGRKVHWGKAGLLDAVVLHADQDDFFDSVFEEFLHPRRLSPAQRASIRAVREALEEDAASFNKAERRGNQADDFHKVYVPLMEAIGLSRCPNQFASAYRAHIEAWRRNDKLSIESTWTDVVRQARSYGVGTLFRNPLVVD